MSHPTDQSPNQSSLDPTASVEESKPRQLPLGPLAFVGSIPAGEGKSTLEFRRRFAFPIERVWDVLTNPEHLTAWAPFASSHDLGQLGSAVLTMKFDGKTMEFACEVRIANRPTLLEYTWGDAVMRWELSPDGEGTNLVLFHTEDGRDWMPSRAAGWHMCLVVADLYLAGTPFGPIVGMEAVNHGWPELNAQYSEALGIENPGVPDVMKSA